MTDRGSTLPPAGARERRAGGGWIGRIGRVLGAGRARLPLATALASAFGLMLLSTLAVVLGLSFYVGATNTRQLLIDKSNLLLDMLQERIDDFLVPVASQLRLISSEIVARDRPEQLLTPGSALHGILAATPQILGVLFVTPELRAYRYRAGQSEVPPEDWSDNKSIGAIVANARAVNGVVWGPPTWSDELRKTVINAHLAIERNGKLYGVLFAAVGLDTMASFVGELSSSVGQPVFVLQGRNQAVAAPGLDMSMVGPDRPLPLLVDNGNPVLAALWVGSTADVDILEGGLRGSARLATAGNDEWLVLYREIPGFGDQPWIVGTYLPASIAVSELARLRYALLLSLGCLVVAVAATFWLGRRMARPVERLADAARRIQLLQLSDAPELPRSRILELDHAARAFNAMRNGLSWFETYVPRRLVRQLMTNPSPAVVASRQLEVTVLFTDIVGFSRLAQKLDAASAAELLNRHFELLAGCVGETDGTVDKFLGDGMMAFWGAP
ncbi:MAG: adenylate/guanylate cyclase domain-containing protein, partial [Geminicoccaceae bacterium]